MAWEARLASSVAKDLSGLKLEVLVEYYDVATPAVVLHSKSFAFDPATAGTEMRQTIIDEGQAAQKAQARATQIATAFPQGSKIAIP